MALAAAALVREWEGEANPCRDRGLVCTSDTMAAPPPPASPPAAALAKSIGLCELGIEELLPLPPLDEPSVPRGNSGRRLPDLLDADPALPPPIPAIIPPLTVVVAASPKPPYVRRCRAPLSVPTRTDTTPPPPDACSAPLPPPPPPPRSARLPRLRGVGDVDAAASSNGLLPLAEWASRSEDVDDAKGLVLPPREEEDTAPMPPPLPDVEDDPDAGDGYTLMERGDDEGRRSHTESMVAIVAAWDEDSTRYSGLTSLVVVSAHHGKKQHKTQRIGI